MYLTAIVLAAGRGLRFRSRVSKPLAEINSRPILIYCLKRLSRHPLVRDIVVVANPRNLRAITGEINRFHVAKVKAIVLGGEERRDSVRRGLEALGPGADMVLVHDAVRPFITDKLISAVIRQAARSGAAIVGVPVKPTIKRVTAKFTVKETIPRKDLWEIQTPQVFKRKLIVQAYRKFGFTESTDDAMLVERLGAKVSVVPGTYDNIKITTPDDMVIARAIAGKSGR